MLMAETFESRWLNRIWSRVRKNWIRDYLPPRQDRVEWSFLEKVSSHHDTVHGEDVLKRCSHGKFSPFYPMIAVERLVNHSGSLLRNICPAIEGESLRVHESFRAVPHPWERVSASPIVLPGNFPHQLSWDQVNPFPSLLLLSTPGPPSGREGSYGPRTHKSDPSPEKRWG